MEDFMKEILDISGYDVPWDDDRKLYIFVVGTK